MRIKEIFYSLQGEGYHTGRAAVFVRFSGCNIRCPFCDTDFTKGVEWAEESLAETVRSIAGSCRFVVLTGGEPTLQVTESFISLLHEFGFEVAMETNGTRPRPAGLDWVTISPKDQYVKNAKVCIDGKLADEVKVVYDGENDVSVYRKLAKRAYIQPCDTGDAEKNREILRKTVEWVKEHPDWKLSLQTQKILEIR